MRWLIAICVVLIIILYVVVMEDVTATTYTPLNLSMANPIIFDNMLLSEIILSTTIVLGLYLRMLPFISDTFSLYSSLITTPAATTVVPATFASMTLVDMNNFQTAFTGVMGKAFVVSSIGTQLLSQPSGMIVQMITCTDYTKINSIANPLVFQSMYDSLNLPWIMTDIPFVLGKDWTTVIANDTTGQVQSLISQLAEFVVLANQLKPALNLLMSNIAYTAANMQ